MTTLHRATAQSATVAFLFTDIEGSTRAWETDPTDTSQRLARHDEVVRRSVTSAGGTVFKHTGDGAAATFAEPAAALLAAASIQRQLPEVGLRVRMAVHAGAAEHRDGDWFGITPTRCARIMAAAHGGQVLVSAVVAGLLAGCLPDGFELVDVGEHDLRDLRAPERLFQLAGPRLARSFPPLRTARAGVALPRPRSLLVGRAVELTNIDAAFGQSALVTLTGPGGSGKTRLAIEVAHRLADGFPGGAAFVDLAPVERGSLVADAVARAVGIAGGVTDDDTDTVAGWLAGRRMLIVIDNCEHVADACAAFVDSVLERCDGVALLATSREPLGVEGEGVVSVTPLTPEDAVALFVQRAGPDVAGQPVVHKICERLDGIPLAVELAAARAATMPLDDVLRLLDDRFDALVASSRGVAKRQRTLAATIDWSYDLLNHDEQTLLRTIAVFAGRFDLDDLIGVAAHESLRTEAVTRLASLVTKSLVIFEEERYHLFETVRMYCRQKLADAGEECDVRDRHRDHFLARAGDGSVWPAEGVTDRDLADHRLALAWSEQTGRNDLVIVHAARLTQQWLTGVRTAEGLHWLRHADEVDENLSTDDRVRWRLTRAWCHIGQSDGVAAWDALRGSSSLVPEDHHLLPAVYAFRGWILSFVDTLGALTVLDDGRALPGFASHSEYPRLFDYREATAHFLARDFVAADALFTSLVIREGHGGASAWARIFSGLARTFAGRLDDASAMLATTPPEDVVGFYFVDLGDAFARCMLAHHAGDKVEAARWLDAILATTTDRYAHVRNGWGIGLIAAAVLAEHDPPVAATLIAGIDHAGITQRFEGGLVAAQLLRGRLAAALDGEELAAAEADGRQLALDELIAIASGAGAI